MPTVKKYCAIEQAQSYRVKLPSLVQVVLNVVSAVYQKALEWRTSFSAAVFRKNKLLVVFVRNAHLVWPSI